MRTLELVHHIRKGARDGKYGRNDVNRASSDFAARFASCRSDYPPLAL